MYYTTLSNAITTGRFNEDYKLRVICHLSQSPGFQAVKEDLCKILSSTNKDKPHPYFMSHGTVFDVLSNRLGLIDKVAGGYKLAGKLTKIQQAKIKSQCAEKIKELGF
jgi:hypothetical protein